MPTSYIAEAYLADAGFEKAEHVLGRIGVREASLQKELSKENAFAAQLKPIMPKATRCKARLETQEQLSELNTPGYSRVAKKESPNQFEEAVHDSRILMRPATREEQIERALQVDRARHELGHFVGKAAAAFEVVLQRRPDLVQVTHKLRLRDIWLILDHLQVNYHDLDEEDIELQCAWVCATTLGAAGDTVTLEDFLILCAEYQPLRGAIRESIAAAEAATRAKSYLQLNKYHR